MSRSPLPVLIALLAAVFLVRPADAAPPPSDRIGVARSGRVAGHGELGMELGLGWWEGPRSPFRFKAGMGRFEHRLAMDMAGYGAGAPGLALESKLALVEGKHGALAPIVMTTIPMAGEIWRGQLGMLGLLESSGGVALRGDLALQLDGYGDFMLPVALLVDVPVSQRWALVMDTSAASVAPSPHGFLVALGTAWRPTDILTADARIGWDIDAGSPMATIGLATSLGKVRR